MTEPSGVSVVLPCYNRGAYLARWLEACAWWQPYEFPVEILVIDDGGADHTEAVVEHARDRGLDVRYQRLRGAGGPRNNAQARNAGIRAARHPLVLNSDPDIVYVTDVIRLLVAGWRPGVFCSVSAYYPLTRESSREISRAGERRALVADDYLRHLAGRHNLVHRPDGVHGLHGAFLCDRATLVEMRGYDERFHVWGWEDRDLLTRLEQGLGFERRVISGATVAHQWHPALRADTDPQDDAARSRAWWQMGWQQTCATTLTSIVRNDRGWGEWTTTGHPDGRDERRDFDFDAYRYEAQVWQREGRPRVARARLHVALTRWWERQAEAPRFLEDDEIPLDRLEAMVVDAHEHGYAHAGDAAIEYAIASTDAGDRHAAEVALAVASRVSASKTAVAHCRARWLASDGQLADAVAQLEGALTSATADQSASGKSTPTSQERDLPDPHVAAAAAFLVELLLRLGDLERARGWIAAVRDLKLGVFDRLLFDGYGYALCEGVAEVAWPPRTGDDPAGEFLFSVAMRARRAGWFFGARVMFDACLASTPSLEAPLPARAAELRREVDAAWSLLCSPLTDARTPAGLHRDRRQR
jgi:GT2 family glycosyltransferase